jgi:hypothetical protein
MNYSGAPPPKIKFQRIKQKYSQQFFARNKLVSGSSNSINWDFVTFNDLNQFAVYDMILQFFYMLR